MKSRPLQASQQFVLVFQTGDEVTRELLRFANENEIRSAFFFGVGAFERVTLGYFDLAKKEYERIRIDAQVEVMSLAGNISRYEDEPKLHAHIVVGKRDGSAHGGHLIEGVVRPTLEVFVTTSGTQLRRELNEATNLPLLDLDQ